MKEAMWEVDPLGDFRFSDATDPGQTLLFDAPTVAPPAEDLSAKFRGGRPVPVMQVENYVNDGTPYLEKHMREALQLLERNRRLNVADLKTDGKKRRAGTFPQETLIIFPS
jgi:hypothetical protein